MTWPARLKRALTALTFLVPMGCNSCQCQAPTRPARDPSSTLRHGIGTNLDFAVDWSTELPFVDLMKSSRAWISGTIEEFEGGPPIVLDGHGWPTQLAEGQIIRTLMAWDMTRHPRGLYTILWEGDGELDIVTLGAGHLLETDRLRERGERRLVIDIDPSRDGAGIILNIVRINASDPIRNIRVIVPGGACDDVDGARYCDAETACAGPTQRCIPFSEGYASQIFHPRFLASMQDYSVIRFMNWDDANSTMTPSFDTDITTRTELDDARWAPRVPHEVMFELARRAHADAWITIPFRADDHYIEQIGIVAGARLNGAQRVWVEYSNEVWNSMFPQHAYATEQGQRLFPNDPPDEAMLHFYARRSREVHARFAAGLGDDVDAPTQMVRVIAGQSGSTWRNEQILDFEETYRHADVLAIAPYFGAPIAPEEYAAWQARDLDYFFAHVEEQHFGVVEEQLRAQRDLAWRRGLPMVAYEGGQHFLAPGSDSVTALLGQANRDPRMEAVYDHYLALWTRYGGTAFVHMTDCAASGPFGSWGAMEYQGQPLEETPKRRALLAAALRTRVQGTLQFPPNPLR